VEGDRGALPGLALTPYLVGLLVLLGMLGTFLGMVATLKGTGLALENAADVDAIRASLAAPVKGLGLAFGASVAGVATSAMLGLMSALARAERMRRVQQLDGLVATHLQSFTRTAQATAHREATLRLMQAQAEALPALVGPLVGPLVAQLQALAQQLEQQAQAQQASLLSSQTRFHAEAQQAYAALAASVQSSLQNSLQEGAQLAMATLAPAVQATLAGLSREALSQREALGAAVHQQLAGAQAQLQAATQAAVETTLNGLTQQTQAMLAGVAEAQAQAQHAAAMREGERLQAFQASMAALSHSLLAEVGVVLKAAAQAPLAATQAMAELRQAVSESLVRDNTVLEERNRLLGTLAQLLDTVKAAGTEQRAAIDAMVRASTELLDRVGERFAHTVEAEGRSLQTVAAQVLGSAAEVSGSAALVAGLGQGFGAGVQQFTQASEQLTAHLQRIETALSHSMARSDEQLAYYVAQAREIVDLTLGTQKQIVDDMQKLAARPAGPKAVAV
jgi:hypothetical protein